MEQEKETQLEKIQNEPKIPPLPPWPTTKRGPFVTEPPPGQRRVHLRTDQVVEVGYDQERGMPSVPPSERVPEQTSPD